MPYLICQHTEKNLRWTVKLSEEPVSIGRSRDADVSIKDLSVSKNHLEILRKFGRYHFRDMGSRNGTFINEMRSDSGPLSFGDELRIGKILISYQRTEAPDVESAKAPAPGALAASEGTEAYREPGELPDPTSLSEPASSAQATPSESAAVFPPDEDDYIEFETMAETIEESQGHDHLVEETLRSIFDSPESSASPAPAPASSAESRARPAGSPPPIPSSSDRALEELRTSRGLTEEPRGATLSTRSFHTTRSATAAPRSKGPVILCGILCTVLGFALGFGFARWTRDDPEPKQIDAAAETAAASETPSTQALFPVARPAEEEPEEDILIIPVPEPAKKPATPETRPAPGTEPAISIDVVATISGPRIDLGDEIESRRALYRLSIDLIGRTPTRSEYARWIQLSPDDRWKELLKVAGPSAPDLSSISRAVQTLLGRPSTPAEESKLQFNLSNASNPSQSVAQLLASSKVYASKGHIRTRPEDVVARSLWVDILDEIPTASNTATVKKALAQESDDPGKIVRILLHSRSSKISPRDLDLEARPWVREIYGRFLLRPPSAEEEQKSTDEVGRQADGWKWVVEELALRRAYATY